MIKAAQQKHGPAKAKALPGKVLTGIIAQVKKSCRALKNRYGPRYTKAMVLAAFIALFVPIPGSLPLAVVSIVVIAEGHRAISKRGGFRRGYSPSGIKELNMSIHCDVILQRGATPEQLTAVGASLWGWCNRSAKDGRIYQFLDNQPLADLIAGKFPALRQITVRDEVSQDRQATVDSLLRDMPAKGVEDILVGGTSWNRIN